MIFESLVIIVRIFFHILSVTELENKKQINTIQNTDVTKLLNRFYRAF